MREGIQYRREKLGRHWGPLPFGVERNEQGVLIPTSRTYILDGVERQYIDALHFIYIQYATGNYGFNNLADLANEVGWRYYTLADEAKHFTSESIRRIIAAWQLYRGDLPTGKLQNKKTPRLWPAITSIFYRRSYAIKSVIFALRDRGLFQNLPARLQ